jgi:peptidoglycan-associated lipoprotein
MRRAVFLFSLLLAALALLGCRPKYPNCDQDKDCAKKNKGEVCVSGKCVECKDDKGCDKGEQCKAGSCEEIADYCESKADCSPGTLCKANRCVPGCDVSADCTSGQKCQQGECVGADKCSTDADCITGQSCTDNRCVTTASETPLGSCTLQTVYFEYNSDEIKGESAKLLESNAECAGRPANAALKIVIKGFTDPRGTEEYNLSLGERRALVVKDFLTRLGVDPARIRTFSNGAEYAAGGDEDGWKKDRRAELGFE